MGHLRDRGSDFSGRAADGLFPAPRPTAVVPLPAEIDGTNAREAGKDLLAAILPGVTVIVVDMTATTFCDSAGINMLALARSQATLQKAKLILAVPSAAVLRILAVTGLDLLTPIYPSLDEALSADSLPEAEATPASRTRRPV